MPTLLILAAGMGSRYGGLKQLDPVGPSGEVVLDYSVHDALRAGFDRVVFVIRRDFEEEFRRAVVSRYEGRVAVEIVYQELNDLPDGLPVPEGRAKPWGTGHAIWCARHAVREPFLAVNADDFYGQEAYSIMAAFLNREKQQSKTEFAMVAYPLRNTLSEHGAVSRGICALTPAGHLVEVEECTGILRRADGSVSGMDTAERVRRLAGDEMVSMNFWGFTPAVFPLLERLFGGFLRNGGLENAKSEFYIPSAVTALIGSGEASVSVLASSGRWFGVTYREDRAAVVAAMEEMTRSGLYQTPLWRSRE